jgi:hypothetical protein
MNIFFTSSCPEQCALDLDLKRVNKMILETAQMLSTALLVHRVGVAPNKDNKALYSRLCNDYGLYKPSHANHPSNIWVRETRTNFIWALEHMKALYKVKLAATGKGHASSELIPIFEDLIEWIPEGELTPFANCAANQSVGVDFKHLEVHTAYRAYLSERWRLDKIEPKWYDGKEPEWRIGL